MVALVDVVVKVALVNVAVVVFEHTFYTYKD